MTDRAFVPRRGVFVITGMHRSGTSLLASLVESAGVSMGERLGAPSKDNPHGFFEDQDFSAFHERILARSGTNYLFDPAVELRVSGEDESRARAVIESRAGLGAWGWKDPRTCLFLGLWSRLLPDARWLFIYRHPVAVVLSLLERADLETTILDRPEAGLSAWLRYNRLLLDFVKGNPGRCVLLHSDGLVKDPRTANRIVSEKLGLKDWDLERLHAETFHSFSLSHDMECRFTERFPEAATLYRELQHAADLPWDPKAGDEGSPEVVWDRAAAVLGAMARGARGLRSEVARLQRDVAERTLEVSRQQEVLDEMQEVLDGMLKDRSRWRASSGGPWIADIHPRWLLEQDDTASAGGQPQLTVYGTGFSPEAVIVAGNHPIETTFVRQGVLRAAIPDFLRWRGSRAVWVEDRGGALSNIRCLRIFNKEDAETLAAPGPASWSRRWKRLKLAARWRLKLAAFYARRRIRRARAWRGAWKRRLRDARAGGPAAILGASSDAGPRRLDILCFSIIDWDFRFQRPQQLLTRFAKEGHRVFYVSVRFLPPGGGPFQVRTVAPNVHEVSLRLPLYRSVYEDRLCVSEEESLYQALLDFKAAARLSETVSLVHLPFWTPLALRLKKDFGYRVVFDCMDDFAGFGNTSPAMLAWEDTLAKEADLVVASSKKLLEKQKGHNANCVLVPNAADYEHFSAAVAPSPVIAAGGGPVFGYYGAIAHWFDAELLAQAAARRPDWRFVFIGRADKSVCARFKGLANTSFLPEQPYAALPGSLAGFDVCLIPFKIDALIEATSPVKFFEYMAAGKPVVAARLPELEPFAESCHLYAGLEDFLSKAAEALVRAKDPALVERRRQVARANTWEMRRDVLSNAVAALYPKASVIVVTYNGLELTKACVDSLFAKTGWPDWELVIVDNASTDGTREYLESLRGRSPRVRVILNETNRGFAAANNQGLLAAAGDFLVLLNNDTVVTHGWLGGLLHHLEDPSIGLVGPVTNNIGNEAKIEVSYKAVAGLDAFAEGRSRACFGKTFEIPMLAMFCVAMRRSLRDAVGLLDERYEVGMFEDDDFSRSVRKAGCRVVCAEDVFIHHVGGASFKKLKPEIYQQLFERNRAKFEAKWGEPWVPHRYRVQEKAAESSAVSSS